MTIMEDTIKNKMEQAFELSIIFAEILSFKEALSLTNDEVQFLYNKINEVKEIEELVNEVIDGGNHDI